MFRLRTTLAAAAVTFVVAARGVAQAGSVRIEGQFCKFKDAWKNQWGSINNSSSAATIYCPTAFDEIQRPLLVRVELWHRSADTPSTCTLFAKNFDGSIAWMATKSTQVVSASSQNLDFVGFPNLFGFSVKCSLPGVAAAGPSGISSVRIDW